MKNFEIKEVIWLRNNEDIIIDYVDERVNNCLKRGIDKKQIAEWLDGVIYNLPEDSSSELFNLLYRVQDNLLFGDEF